MTGIRQRNLVQGQFRINGIRLRHIAQRGRPFDHKPVYADSRQLQRAVINILIVRRRGKDIQIADSSIADVHTRRRSHYLHIAKIYVPTGKARQLQRTLQALHRHNLRNAVRYRRIKTDDTQRIHRQFYTRERAPPCQIHAGHIHTPVYQILRAIFSCQGRQALGCKNPHSGHQQQQNNRHQHCHRNNNPQPRTPAAPCLILRFIVLFHIIQRHKFTQNPPHAQRRPISPYQLFLLPLHRLFKPKE